MITDRYYYKRLTDAERAAYSALYDGVMSFESRIEIPQKVSGESVNRIFSAITNDNPYLYYMNQTQIGFTVSGERMWFTPGYYFTKEQAQRYNREIEKRVNDLVSSVSIGKPASGLSGLFGRGRSGGPASAREKILLLHDRLASEITYDHDADVTPDKTDDILAHSFLGPLLYNKGVCEGIAEAFKFCLNVLEIPCIKVTGTGSGFGKQRGPHAWNIVSVDGSPCQFDLTWDICGTKDGKVCHDYFALPDEAIRIDHFDFDGVPSCNTWNENYHVKNGWFFQTPEQAENYIEHCIRNGNADEFDLRMDLRFPASEIKPLFDRLMHFAIDTVLRQTVGIRSVRTYGSYNDRARTVRFRIM